MARVIPAPSFKQFSGMPDKAGSTVFYPRRGNTFARIKSTTPYKYTPAQVLLTSYNRIATQAFSHITDEQRDTWKIYAPNFTRIHMGITCPLTDREAYIGVNVHRQINQQPLSHTAPLIPINTFNFSLSDIWSTTSGPGLLFSLTHDALDYDTAWFLCRASLSFPSSNRRARKNEYRLAGSVNHTSFFPVQPSPQQFYFPTTPFAHIQDYFLFVQLMIFSPDYYQGLQLSQSSQVSLQDCIWRYSSTDYIKYNPSPSSIEFYISSTLVSTLFANGTLYISGEVEEFDPSVAPSVYNYISFDVPTSQIRLAYKTNSSPGFKCFMTFDASGNINLYGEIHEFSDLSSLTESNFFHPYVDPRKVQLSCDRVIPSMVFQVDDSPTNALLLREVTEYVI